MENRSPFEGQTQAEWFIAVGEKSIGPMTASEIYDRVIAGELTWISYVWKEGMGEWARLADVPTFKAAVPPPPAMKPKSQPPAPPAATKKIQIKEWFLYYNDSQFGPYTEDEVEGMAGIGKISDDTFAWKDGQADWEKLGSLSHFAGLFKPGVVTAPMAGIHSAAAAAEKGSEKRAYSRKPLLAKVILAEGDKIIVGMARDISIGGMQVLSDFVPSKAGSKLKLNVSPAEPNNPLFTPFVAEGIVVRLHEDRRGFSFRFDELSASARQIIERLIQS